MRGQIEDRARKQQIADFSGLIFGKITPTDVDGVIEYHDKAYVFFELKYLDAKLPYGQRLCLKRLVDDTERSNKKAVVLVLEHDISDCAIDIPAAQCRVREYYTPKKGWVKLDGKYNALEMTQKFFSFVDSNTKSTKYGAHSVQSEPEIILTSQPCPSAT